MLGVCGFFDVGGSSSDDSTINILQRGLWCPGGLRCSLYHSLQAFTVRHSGAAVPHSDAGGQNGLNYTAIEIPDDFRRNAKFLQPPPEEAAKERKADESWRTDGA